MCGKYFVEEICTVSTFAFFWRQLHLKPRRMAGLKHRRQTDTDVTPPHTDPHSSAFSSARKRLPLELVPSRPAESAATDHRGPASSFLSNVDSDTAIAQLRQAPTHFNSDFLDSDINGFSAADPFDLMMGLMNSSAPGSPFLPLDSPEPVPIAPLPPAEVTRARPALFSSLLRRMTAPRQAIPTLCFMADFIGVRDDIITSESCQEDLLSCSFSPSLILHSSCLC